MAEVSIGDSKMKVAEFMQKTEQSRNLMENYNWKWPLHSQVFVKRISRLMQSKLKELLLKWEDAVQKRQDLNLRLEKLVLEENHQQLLKKLETIKNEIETLERLATNRRNEEASLTSRLTELRERAAVLREQISYEKTAIR